jgi:hypothetical protein
MASQAIYGIVANRKKAEQLVQHLVDAGITSNDISIASSESSEYREFSKHQSSPESIRNWRSEDRVVDYPADARTEHGKTSAWNKHATDAHYATEKRSKAPEGATAGGLTGGIIGCILGLLAGIGSLALPGMGALIAAGPILGALSGLGLGGALGGILGALIGAGIPEYEAKRHENHTRENGFLISVLANNETLAKRVKELLQREGAEDVTVSSGEYAATAGRNYNRR